jgi:cytochrome c oxidase subunit 1
MSVRLTSLALVRGLIGYFVGFAAGMLLVMASRLMLGMEAWEQEAVYVGGIVFAILSFLLASGAMTDWLKWTRGIATPMRHGPPPGQPSWTRYFGIDYNHKVIGIQYGVTALLLLMVGGTLALIFRRTEWQSRASVFVSSTPTTSSSACMAGWRWPRSCSASAALANYLVPLMIGAEDMAFPRLNAFAYWINVPGDCDVADEHVVRLGFGLDGLSAAEPAWRRRLPDGLSGDLCHRPFLNPGLAEPDRHHLLMRPKGMTLFRMPIFCWAVLATSLIQLTATQFIGSRLPDALLRALAGDAFLQPDLRCGWRQHRRAADSVPAPLLVLLAPGGLRLRAARSGHHQRVAAGLCPQAALWLPLGCALQPGDCPGGLPGLGPPHVHLRLPALYLRVVFMISTLLVAVPTGVKFFSWLGTLWGGRLTFPTPMLFTLGAISVFLIGGLSGPVLATVATDLFLHDTYFVVGHFHATIFGGFVFPFFAAIYYWYPKITGRMYNETLGKLHFWLMTPGFWLMSMAQMTVGTMGMRRRIADYDPALGWRTYSSW